MELVLKKVANCSGLKKNQVTPNMLQKYWKKINREEIRQKKDRKEGNVSQLRHCGQFDLILGDSSPVPNKKIN